jgi:glutathione peroxidase
LARALDAACRIDPRRAGEILGFPANDFMGQEPGTSEEIAEFCEMNYGVTFPLFEKISVKGEDMHPLYQEITSMPEPIGGDVLWNFQKYLLDRDGNVVAKFGPRTTPEDPELVGKIEELLG